MKALVPLLITLLITASPATDQGLRSRPDWIKVNQQISKSVVRLDFIKQVTHPFTGEMAWVPSNCTAWSFRLDGMLSTAAHCAEGKEHYVGGTEVEIVNVDKKQDLA